MALIQYLPLCAGLAVKYGLPMEEGLKALTIYPARICRADRRVGSLKPGKDADIAKQYPPMSDSLYANSRTLDIGKACWLIFRQLLGVPLDLELR